MALKNILSSAFIGFLALMGPQAMAATYNFDRVTYNAPVDIGSQLFMDVTESDGGVLFKFSNHIGVQSSITDIYFDDMRESHQVTSYVTKWKWVKVNNQWTLQQVVTPVTQTVWDTVLFDAIVMEDDSGAGVSFDSHANPGNLPGGNAIGFTSDFSGDSNSPVSHNGLDAVSEWVSFFGTLNSGKSFDDVLASLAEGDFRVGLHVQSIKTGNETGRHYYGDYCEPKHDDYSDSYVNGAEIKPVPLPAAAWLFGTALIGFVVASNRRRV